MKAMALTGIRQMEICDWPKPEIIRDTDVLLRIGKIGVCGSDVHYYETGKIGSATVEYPFILGHECSAMVEAVGKSVTKVKVGDRIVLDPASSCGECDQCRCGRFNTCRNLRFLGTPGEGHGCLCEYLVMPETSCYSVSDAISDEEMILCEPFAIGVYAVGQAQVAKDAIIGVLGSGPIGLSCLAAIKSQCHALIYMTDKIESRMKTANQAGATWVGNPLQEDAVPSILGQQPLGLDVVFECAGQQETFDEAIDLIKPGGKLMLIGIPREERVSFDISKIRRKEITIVNVRRQNASTQRAIDLIAAGKAKVDFMVTHRFEFEQTQQAFDMVSEYRDGVVKALIGF